MFFWDIFFLVTATLIFSAKNSIASIIILISTTIQNWNVAEEVLSRVY